MAYLPGSNTPAVSIDDLLRRATGNSIPTTMIPAYGLGASLPPALKPQPVGQLPTANQPAITPTQPGIPRVAGAPSPLQTTPPTTNPAFSNEIARLKTVAGQTPPTLPGAPPGPTLPTVPTLPTMPMLPTVSMAMPSEPVAPFPTAPGPGAGGYSPVQNTPGVGINPYGLYARPEGAGVGYTSPQGSATFQGRAAKRNALGLKLGAQGQGTLSALGGPSDEQQMATAQTVAGIESQIAALQGLSAARGSGGPGAFGPLVSVGRPGQGFGDEVMAADRAERAFSGSPYDTPRTRRANAMGAMEARAQAANLDLNQRKAQTDLIGDYQTRLAQAAALRQAGDLRREEIGMERAKANRMAQAGLNKERADAEQNAFKNRMDVANYITNLGKTSADIEKMRLEAQRNNALLPGQVAKGQMDEMRSELMRRALAGDSEALTLLSSLPGGNAAALQPWMQ